ncbi:MAG: hypothetical protein Kilf2KO_01920 [Rhodospirillales bacterium]
MKIAERWAAVFGEQALCLRLFDRASLHQGDAVADFCKTLDLGDISRFTWRRGFEKSLSAKAQQLATLYNDVFSKATGTRRRGPQDNSFFDAIAKALPGAPKRPPRGLVEEILQRFQDSNEGVRSRWFPEREALFSDDVSAYPLDWEPDVELTAQEVAQVRRTLVEEAAGDPDLLHFCQERMRVIEERLFQQ